MKADSFVSVAALALVMGVVSSASSFAAPRPSARCALGETTWELVEGKAPIGRIQLIGRLDPRKNVQNLTPVHMEMIRKAVTDGKGNISNREALMQFRDEPYGSNAGTIDTYRARGGLMIYIVTYYPGDNEYGAIFASAPGRGTQMVARVGDGDLYDCRMSR